MRKRIYQILDPVDGDTVLDYVYTYGMMAVIVISIIPLAFKETNTAFKLIEYISTAIFMIDYALRIFTADIALKKGPISFLIYPFTFMAIVDLLAILPTFLAISGGFKVLKLFRLMRTMRVFRAFKIFRYSKNVLLVLNVIKRQKSALLAVATLAIGYILIAALVIFNVEPESFNNFFEAVYWATVSLTTVGYGDIYPVSTVGRVVTMISSFIGIAIVALPAGIVTAGYLEEIKK